eukprot:TRINITY_DN19078_c0_g1_i3.p1 TRINITY_DN19078_c0_g1~~TRINITY_DN19078_c0_g1_i3.p1  ORF type:complete len:466 (-),score=54.47 TRINITY_DN19078_c0_g1_i3:532-1791(-)
MAAETQAAGCSPDEQQVNHKKCEELRKSKGEAARVDQRPSGFTQERIRQVTCSSDEQEVNNKTSEGLRKSEGEGAQVDERPRVYTQERIRKVASLISSDMLGYGVCEGTASSLRDADTVTLHCVPQRKRLRSKTLMNTWLGAEIARYISLLRLAILVMLISVIISRFAPRRSVDSVDGASSHEVLNFWFWLATVSLNGFACWCIAHVVNKDLLLYSLQHFDVWEMLASYVASGSAYLLQAEASFDVDFARRMQLDFGMFFYMGPFSLLGVLIDSLDPLHPDVSRRKKAMLLLFSIAFHVAVYGEQRFSSAARNYWTEHVFFDVTYEVVFLVAISRLIFFQGIFCLEFLKGEPSACLYGVLDVLFNEGDDTCMHNEHLDTEQTRSAFSHTASRLSVDQRPSPSAEILPEPQLPGCVPEPG